MGSPETTNYPGVAAAGVRAGRRDALRVRRDPKARFLHLRAGRQRVAAMGDPVALRLYDFAYAFAFGDACSRPRWEDREGTAGEP